MINNPLCSGLLVAGAIIRRTSCTLLLVVALVLGTSPAHAQVMVWNAGGLSGVTDVFPATTVGTGMQQSVLVRGPGVNAASLSSGFNSNSFNVPDFEAALLGDKYLEFTLQAVPGFEYSLETLDARMRRVATGPDAYQWRFAVGDGAFIDVGEPGEIETTSATLQPQLDLSEIAELQGVSDDITVTFRLYLWGASSATGSFAIGGAAGDDLILGGTVTYVGEGPMVWTSTLTLEPFETRIDQPSDAQSYLVNGVELTSGIVVAAPGGFEVSLDGSTYSALVEVPAQDGVASATVFARMTGEEGGVYAGVIQHSSTGAAEVDVAVSGEVSVLPDGPVVREVTAPGVYIFDGWGVTMTFATVPDGGGEVGVELILGEAHPAPPGIAADAYLVITSTMPNYSFAAEVVVAYEWFEGIGASTQTAYFNSGTQAWVLIPSSVNTAQQTVTFTTNHFTPFAFVTLPATPFNVFVGADPSAAAATPVYPNTSWATTDYEPDDWRFDGAEVRFYIVPGEGATFFAADVTVEWDSAVLSLSGASAGSGLFSGANPHSSTFAFFHDPLGSPNRLRINAARLDNQNFVVSNVAGGDQYIAELVFNLLRPGYGVVDLTALDFRLNLGGGAQQPVFAVVEGGAVRAYLGDVTAPGDPSTGDGEVDFEDLILFAGAYWSGVPGGPDPGGTNYKVKFDVGPTGDGTVFTLPQVDGQIQFEDLVIFSLSYGLSAVDAYPRPAPEHPVIADIHDTQSLLVTAEPARLAGDDLLVGISIAGAQDLRALSLSFDVDTDQFEVVGVERGQNGLFGAEDLVFAAAFSREHRGMIDVARIGGAAISGTGEIAVLRLRVLDGAHSGLDGASLITLVGGDARSSTNARIPLHIGSSGTGEEVLPVTFSLSANYPNPFTRSTTITYHVPEAVRVQLSVHDALGRQVAVLVDDEVPAGSHRVVYDAADLASGTYFYRIQAGEFSETRRFTVLR